MSSSSHGQGTLSVSNVHRTGLGSVLWSRYRLTNIPPLMLAPPPAVTCSYLVRCSPCHGNSLWCHCHPYGHSLCPRMPLKQPCSRAFVASHYPCSSQSVNFYAGLFWSLALLGGHPGSSDGCLNVAPSPLLD